MIRAARKDDCHIPLTKEFSRFGWVDCDISQTKKKADAFFAKNSITICVEFKAMNGTLTTDEAIFKAKWEKQGFYYIVRTYADVYAINQKHFGDDDVKLREVSGVE